MRTESSFCFQQADLCCWNEADVVEKDLSSFFRLPAVYPIPTCRISLPRSASGTSPCQSTETTFNKHFRYPIIISFFSVLSNVDRQRNTCKVAVAYKHATNGKGRQSKMTEGLVHSH